MKNLRSSVFSSVRVVLALAIAVVNVALFATSSSAAARGCYTCVLIEGGTMGWVPDCQFGDTGDMATCQERLVDCVGYECPPGAGGEATEMEFEAIPLAFTAPVN